MVHSSNIVAFLSWVFFFFSRLRFSQDMMLLQQPTLSMPDKTGIIAAVNSDAQLLPVSIPFKLGHPREPRNKVPKGNLVFGIMLTMKDERN